MMDVSLLKDPVFMLIGVSNIFGMAGLYVPFVYLVDAAKVAGIEDGQASFLLSVIGITNTFGRVIFGYIADFPSVNSLLLNNLCLVVCTLSVGAIPVCLSYFHYVIVAVFFGTAVSGYISLTSIILVDLLGLDKLTNAFGLLILFRGAAAIVGSPLAGAVYDATNSYSIPFFMAAAFFLVSTVTSFMAPYMKQCTTTEEVLPVVDALTPIDEDEELEAEEEEDDMEEDNAMTVPIPEIVETMPSPLNPEMKSPPKEIKQIESVL
ncbi:monocarboxylate transporter 14-like [Diaphorina citri]|uniref:Monocarboxylate transporter 14-like n=1 Tax=Diaphorina citri TaxID=121845 RepID=A0A3Q0J849_DIACI|nr:monocarboxylate transporter 14-like [Diaphorina citri]